MNPAFAQILRRGLTRRNLAVVAVALLLATLSTCSPRQDLLTQIKTSGVLRIATINSPTTYYLGSDKPAGFEYDLAEDFARQLGVKLQVLVTRSPAAAIELVRQGRAHVAAAAVTITDARKQSLNFSPPLLRVAPQLVYRGDTRAPRDIADLKGTVRVSRGSLPPELLARLRAGNPSLRWEESDLGAEELLYQVANRQLDYTIANSDIVAITQRYYPVLRIAFAVSAPQDIAWGVKRDADQSLSDAVGTYFSNGGGKTLKRIWDRYFGHVQITSGIGAITLAADVQTKLPLYRKAFEEAGAKNQIDWLLLAAMGYQESHWNQHAVSPTGVKGLMMLTLDTAEHLNISDREDPVQSIHGGARYYRMLYDQLPPSIQPPDRSWMALAAYNIGMGHLLDVRKLTRELGGNPNRWLDVRDNLPLLTQAEWHNQTEHGYARGFETVTYVSNVRTYYDMLHWVTSGAPAKKFKPAETEPPLILRARQQQKRDNPLNITTPVF